METLVRRVVWDLKPQASIAATVPDPGSCSKKLYLTSFHVLARFPGLRGAPGSVAAPQQQRGSWTTRAPAPRPPRGRGLDSTDAERRSENRRQSPVREDGGDQPQGVSRLLRGRPRGGGPRADGDRGQVAARRTRAADGFLHSLSRGRGLSHRRPYLALRSGLL